MLQGLLPEQVLIQDHDVSREPVAILPSLRCVSACVLSFFLQLSLSVLRSYVKGGHIT